MIRKCAACSKPLAPVEGPGMPPRYCGAMCRRSLRRKATEDRRQSLKAEYRAALAEWQANRAA